MGIQIRGSDDNISASDGSLTIDGVNFSTLQVNGQNLPTAGPLSNRNLIINGAMQVWQRDTSFASDTVGGGRYTADRWNVPNRTRAARSTDAPAGFTYSLLIDREQTGGVEPFTVSTGIEVQDITQTGSYTLSFYAKSADITTLNINVQDRTGVAEGGTNNSSIVTNEAITIDNTWTRYTHTFTISSVSFTGTSLRISIGNTSADQNDEALITGVQLEAGTVATPFERRSHGQELSLCQRSLGGIDTRGLDANYHHFGVFTSDGATSGMGNISFATPMRARASNIYASAANKFWGYGCTGFTAIAYDQAGINSGAVSLTGGSGGQAAGTAGRFLANNTTDAYILFEAEL